MVSQDLRQKVFSQISRERVFLTLLKTGEFWYDDQDLDPDDWGNFLVELLGFSDYQVSQSDEDLLRDLLGEISWQLGRALTKYTWVLDSVYHDHSDISEYFWGAAIRKIELCGKCLYVVDEERTTCDSYGFRAKVYTNKRKAWEDFKEVKADILRDIEECGCEDGE